MFTLEDGFASTSGHNLHVTPGTAAGGAVESLVRHPADHARESEDSRFPEVALRPVGRPLQGRTSDATGQRRTWALGLA
jgi:hypothetical protein